jgi:hypothetical protein
MSIPPINIFMPGSEVLVDNRLTATVISSKILIGNVIVYECVWWDDNTRHSEWLEAFEVTSNGEETRKLRLNPTL